MLDLDSPAESLKWIGKKRAEHLKKLNIETIKDLLYYLPAKYEEITPINRIIHTDKKIEVPVTLVKFTSSYYKKSIQKAVFKDKIGNFVKAIWFNQKYLKNVLKLNNSYLLCGKIIENNKMIMPQVRSKDKSTFNNSPYFRPLYNLRNLIPQKTFHKIMKFALEHTNITENLPQNFIQYMNILSRETALSILHKGADEIELEKAITRLCSEELFFWFKNMIEDIEIRKLKSKTLKFQLEDMFLIFKKNNIIPTQEQKKALLDLAKDMKSSTPIRRLIHGEVGAGKTLIAFACIYIHFLNKNQTLFLAPTYVLARQQFENFQKIFKNFNLKSALLTAGTSVHIKNKIVKNFNTNKINVLFGTHILISEQITLNSPGLIIIDEQQRFGLKQRQKILSKNPLSDFLLLSATPIPRTLSAALYINMDISILKTKVFKSQQPKTFLRTYSKIKPVIEFILKKAEHEKVFIICPKIYKQNNTSWHSPDYVASVEHITEYLKKFKSKTAVFPLHSDLNFEKRDKILNEFKNSTGGILVTTTVLEVGMDIKDATVMLILNAERFGLSQLHQLRGRVGRYKKDSYCILVTNNIKSERLKLFLKAKDGFEVANLDLKLRGCGESKGIKQHGFWEFKFVDFFDNIDLVKKISKYFKHEYKNNCRIS